MHNSFEAHAFIPAVLSCEQICNDALSDQQQAHASTLTATAMVAKQASKAELLVKDLNSEDAATKLAAVRAVKNQIIGNKQKKLSYIKLGAVESIVELLGSEADTSLRIQSAAAVGSFAYGVDAGAQAVVDSGGGQLPAQRVVQWQRAS